MKGYALVNISTNIVQSIFSWGEASISPDFPIEEGYYVLELHEELYVQASDMITKKEGLKVKNKDAIIYEELFEEVSKSLEQEKLEKIAELKAICEQTILKGFVSSNGYFYRTNRDDQTNMIGQKDELTTNSAITSVPWKTEDAGYMQHTREEWLVIYNEAFAHKKAQLFKYDSLKTKVNSFTTIAEVGELVW